LDECPSGSGKTETSKGNLSRPDLICFGKEVTVKPRGQDRYQRTVAEVILPDGRNLNHEIVKAGFAWWFRRYAPGDETLERLEKEARQARRGLWVDQQSQIPPWEYRKVSRYQGAR
jgi:endonuclease YncB( thermonuclease family)